MTHAIRIIAVTMLLALAAGCTTKTTKEAIEDADIVATSHAAADGLIEKLLATLEPGRPIIATSFASIDQLETSSSLGRIIGEQVASRFTNRGFKVVEMKLRDSVFIKEGAGEFMLSRELRNISKEHDAQAILVGTYAVGKDHLYVTARVVRANDSVILSSHDYRLPIGPDTKAMLYTRR